MPSWWSLPIECILRMAAPNGAGTQPRDGESCPVGSRYPWSACGGGLERLGPNGWREGGSCLLRGPCLWSAFGALYPATACAH